MSSNRSRTGERPATSFRVAAALRLIRSRYAEPALDLRQVAKAVNLSPFHLSRLMKMETGSGFLEHIRHIRVQSAAELLVNSLLTIKEIAAAVGYSHTNDLDRNFKRVCHLTPTEYREQFTSATHVDQTQQVDRV